MAVYPFTPTGQAVFSFQPTLDGQQYSAIVTWSLFGQRWYISIYDVSNTLVVSEAVTGSPNPIGIQSVEWDAGLVTVTTVEAHGYKVGTIATLTIADMVPDAYNGTFECLIRSATTFTYPLLSDPGAATSIGSAAQNLNLVGGYFTDSSLVFREAAQQFEVSP